MFVFLFNIHAIKSVSSLAELNYLLPCPILFKKKNLYPYREYNWLYTTFDGYYCTMILRVVYLMFKCNSFVHVVLVLLFYGFYLSLHIDWIKLGDCRLLTWKNGLFWIEIILVLCLERMKLCKPVPSVFRLLEKQLYVASFYAKLYKGRTKGLSLGSNIIQKTYNAYLMLGRLSRAERFCGLSSWCDAGNGILDMLAFVKGNLFPFIPTLFLLFLVDVINLVYFTENNSIIF